MPNTNKDTTDLKQTIIKSIDDYFGQAATRDDISVKSDFLYNIIHELRIEHLDRIIKAGK